jgi:type II secretory pathway pseudopilin PulG
MRSGLNTSRGFALLDALVALVLFATALLAAMAALLTGMHAMHEAALTGRAVDLASDLLEARRGQPPGAPLQPLLDDWNEQILDALPEEPRATALSLVQPLLDDGDGSAP